MAGSSKNYLVSSLVHE